MFFIQLMLLFYQSDFAFAKPMFGENIRLATEGEFPYTVSIMLNNYANHPQINHECSGTLISKKDILTAEHCLKDKLLNQIKISLGSVNLENGIILYPLIWVTYSEWYELRYRHAPSSLNDIAIIKLIIEVPSIITPVPFQPILDMNFTGLDVVISGWGLRSDGLMSKFMETATVTILDNEDCANRINLNDERRTFTYKKFLCSTANPYVVMGDGNSGGPVLYQGILVAIHTGTLLHTNLCFHPDKINLHSAINFYQDFIIDIMNKNYRYI